MTALATLIFTNQYFIAAIGAIIGALALYYKGYSQASKQADVAQRNAEIEMAHKIQQTEAQNQNIEAEREKHAENVNANSDIDSLIGVWNSTNQQTPGNKTPSNT